MNVRGSLSASSLFSDSTLVDLSTFSFRDKDRPQDIPTSPPANNLVEPSVAHFAMQILSLGFTKNVSVGKEEGAFKALSIFCRFLCMWSSSFSFLSKEEGVSSICGETSVKYFMFLFPRIGGNAC